MSGLFVVATGQDVGKTTVSLGLISLFASRGLRVRFCKPVGQRYVERDGHKVDKDAVLVQTAAGVQGDLSDMSPVTIPHGFVEDYLFNREPEALRTSLQEAFGRLRADCDVVVAEGTGHAGVGSCIDLSNAAVAAMLGLKVVLVTEGGIGSTLDQVALNLSMFEARDVEVLGIIANKVIPEKRERVERALARGLENLGHRLLGAIPYDRSITYPRVRQVADAVRAETLCGEHGMDRRVNKILVAAMAPQNVLPWLEPNTLIITSGDRIDNILVALNMSAVVESATADQPDEAAHAPSVAALILTGGLIPHFTIMNLLKKSSLPVLLCKDSTYEVSSRIQGLVFKMLPEDTDKVARAQGLVKDYVDIEAILATVPGGSHGAHSAR